MKLVVENTFFDRKYNQGIHIKDDDTDKQWLAMNSNRQTILVDVDKYDCIKNKVWSVSNAGYVSNSKSNYLHGFLMGNATSFEYTVDHINQIKTDNRMENLRWATQAMQNSNRPTRDDRCAAPDWLQQIGVTVLPRGVREDKGEGRWVCRDSSIIKDLQNIQEPVEFNGTKSAKYTDMQKLYSCLEKLLQAHNKHERLIPRTSDDSGIRLAKEYIEIAMFAQAQYPAYFSKPQDIDMMDAYMTNDKLYVEFVMSKISTFMQTQELPIVNLGGPKEQTSELINVPEINAIVRVKSSIDGRSTFTIIDAKFENQIRMVNKKGTALLNWDGEDMRIHIYPEIIEQFPRVSDFIDKNKKMRMADFVYHVLEGRPKQDGYFVVGWNQQLNDLRIANLKYLEGEGKNFKSAAKEPALIVDVGMYLPRGVSICKDRNQYMFNCNVNNTKTKISFRGADDAKEKYEAKVLPWLRANIESFDTENEFYQNLMESYNVAKRAVDNY